MRVKSKKSTTLDEKWYHTLDYAKISETMPFLTETRGPTRKVEVYINADLYDRASEMRAKYPNTFPTMSHYLRTIMYPGDILIRGVMDHEHKNNGKGNIFADIFMPMERIMEAAAKRSAAIRSIEVMFEEKSMGTITKQEFEDSVLDILKTLPENLSETVKTYIQNNILCPENIFRIEAKYRKRKSRAVKGEGAVPDRIANISDYRDVPEMTAFLNKAKVE